MSTAEASPELLSEDREWIDHDVNDSTRAELTALYGAATTGDDFVKTSTGFHPAGGASIHAVALMRATVGDRLGVKASGGIRTAADALAMVEAGASRLGLSSSAAILEEMEG